MSSNVKVPKEFGDRFRLITVRLLGEYRMKEGENLTLAFTAIRIGTNPEYFVVEIVPPQLLVERLLVGGLVSYEMVPRVTCLQSILKITKPSSIVR